MKAVSKTNHYETAFASWLVENKLRYLTVDQSKRAVFRRESVKSFDFLIPAADGNMLIAELKGRKFKGDSLAKFSGLQSWVNMDDIDGLDNWQRVFGDGYQAVFVFAYEFESPDVDPCGQTVYHCNGRRYFFYIVPLADYKNYMVLRSPKWRTVTLLVDDFKACAVSAEDYLLNSGKIK